MQQLAELWTQLVSAEPRLLLREEGQRIHKTLQTLNEPVPRKGHSLIKVTKALGFVMTVLGWAAFIIIVVRPRWIAVAREWTVQFVEQIQSSARFTNDAKSGTQKDSIMVVSPSPIILEKKEAVIPPSPVPDRADDPEPEPARSASTPPALDQIVPAQTEPARSASPAPAPDHVVLAEPKPEKSSPPAAATSKAPPSREDRPAPPLKQRRPSIRLEGNALVIANIIESFGRRGAAPAGATVHLTGDFNGWEVQGPLIEIDKDGTGRADVSFLRGEESARLNWNLALPDGRRVWAQFRLTEDNDNLFVPSTNGDPVVGIGAAPDGTVKPWSALSSDPIPIGPSR